MDNQINQAVDTVTAKPESTTCDAWAAISMANQQEAINRERSTEILQSAEVGTAVGLAAGTAFGPVIGPFLGAAVGYTIGLVHGENNPSKRHVDEQSRLDEKYGPCKAEFAEHGLTITEHFKPAK